MLTDEIFAKTILSPYKKGDEWFGANYNMNIYRGCSHGCIYCDSRSECYGISDFDRVRVKKDALIILEKELISKRKRGVVDMGSMSDPYNPLEKSKNLTRGALESINRHGFGVTLTTKSSLVIRDIDIFKEIQRHSPVLIKITVTTPHDSISRLTEPYASLSSERLEALKILSAEGIDCCVLILPCLPFIEDKEEDILLLTEKIAAVGVTLAYGDFGVTLRDRQRDWFYQKLDETFPGLKKKYMSQYGNSYFCGSPYYKNLYNKYITNCNKLGIIYKQEDIRRYYKRGYYEDKQLTFFTENGEK